MHHMQISGNSRDAKVKARSIKKVTKSYAGRGNYNFLKISLFCLHIERGIITLVVWPSFASIILNKYMRGVRARSHFQATTQPNLAAFHSKQKCKTTVVTHSTNLFLNNYFWTVVAVTRCAPSLLIWCSVTSTFSNEEQMKKKKKKLSAERSPQ